MKMKHIAILMVFLLLIHPIYADLGPKPTVDIDIRYDGQEIADSVFYAKMLGCHSDEDIRRGFLRINRNETGSSQLMIIEFDPLENCTWFPSMFAWGGTCKNSGCGFTYAPPSEFRLAVYIPSMNRTFVGPKVYNGNFDASYLADLMPDGSIAIRDTTSFLRSNNGVTIRNFLTSLFITVFIELAAIHVLLSSLKEDAKKYLENRNRMLAIAAMANLVSLPIVWFAFPLLFSGVT